VTQRVDFTPALRFNVLTPLYDWVVRLTTRESVFKRRLVDAASIENGESVLDVGCGTGTLLREIVRRESSARVTGLDADPAILEIARRKLVNAGTACELVQGNSTQMPFADDAFDHVVSTLFFHHLRREDKRITIEEIMRVLRPGGSVHIADWGPPTGLLQRLAFYQIQVLDGFETTRDHVSGVLTALFRETGFCRVTETAYLRTVFGTLRFLQADKSPASEAD
jgi:ubiquinone/menaquinone biosynthesis C-methylase UbiE